MTKGQVEFKKESLRKKRQLPIGQDRKDKFITNQLDKWEGLVERMGESGSEYRVFVGRPEGQRSLGRPRSTWQFGIKMDIQEVESVLMGMD